MSHTHLRRAALVAGAWSLSVFFFGPTAIGQTSSDVGHAVTGQGSAPMSTRWSLKPHITVPDEKNMKGYASDPAERVKPGAVLKRIDGEQNRFHIEVPDINNVKAEQKEETLCWAASSQMVLLHDHVQGETDQEKLAARFRPDRQDKSANDAIIMRAINPDLDREMDKNTIPLTIQEFPNTSDQLIQQLCQNELVIVGLVQNKMGHVCIIHGATFGKVNETLLDPIAGAFKVRNVYALYEVDVFDPWPDTDTGGGMRKLSGADFKAQVTFLTSKPLAHDELYKALHPPQTTQNPQKNQRSAQGSGSKNPIKEIGDMFKPDKKKH